MEIEEPTKILQDVHQRDFHTHYKNSAIWKTRNPSCSFCWWKGCTLFQVQPGCSIHIWVFFRWSVFPSTSNSLSSRVAFSWANVCHPLSLVSESQTLPSHRGFCYLLLPLMHHSSTKWWWGELVSWMTQNLGIFTFKFGSYLHIHPASMCEFFVCLTCQYPLFYLAFFRKGWRGRKIKVQPPKRKKKLKMKTKVAGKCCSPACSVVQQKELMLPLTAHSWVI